MKGTGAKMNGILLLPVLILALALLIGSSVKASAEEPPTPLEKIKSADNLAKGKPTYASSGNSKLGVDGNTGTRWESDHGNDDEWFFVDLGEIYEIESVAFFWETAYAEKYELQVSDDGNAWKTAETITRTSIDSKNGDEDVFSVPAKGRYVRMKGIKRDTQYGYSFWEMGVFGTSTGEPGTDYKEIKPDNETWILLIGNSLTDYNDLKGKLKNMYTASGRKARVDTIINLGQSLNYTADQSGTKEKIVNGQYDYVVLQDQTANTSAAKIREGMDKLYPWIQEAGSKPVFYMIWALTDAIDTPSGSDVINAYTELAEEYDALLAPCGIIWKQFWDLGENWYTDNRHPNNVGSFMVASTLYYTMTKETAPADFSSLASSNNVTADLNEEIQKRACKESCIANGLSYTGEEPYEPEPKATNVYAQVRSDSTEEAESTDIRFLATLSSLDYKRAGFVFSMKKTVPALDKADCETVSTTTIYRSVLADGVSVTASELDGSDYICACAVSDIPQDYYNFNFYVRSFVESADGEILYSDTRTVRPVELTDHYASKSKNAAKAGYASSNDRQQGKTAGNGSDLNQGYSVGNLTDNSDSSYIVSEKNDPAPWFIADLQTPAVINKVEVVQGGGDSYKNSYAARYKVQVSDDADQWQTVAIVTDGALGSREISFRSVKARYVRVLVTQKGPDSQCCSLYELRVYETDTDNEMVKGGGRS